MVVIASCKRPSGSLLKRWQPANETARIHDATINLRFFAIDQTEDAPGLDTNKGNVVDKVLRPRGLAI